MNISLVMTIIGADRPGLVGRLSTVIAEHGGNWLESRMAHLGGQFAGILRIEIPAAKEQALLKALGSLEPQGLSVSAQRDAPSAATAARNLATIEVIGHDRPGIIREISQVLAQHQVNVEELMSGCESAPMSGETLFRARAKVRLPDSFEVDTLRHALERIESDLMVDIAVTPSP
ncbi:MAG TPA: ACT domain-containing protein [Verrucomicrobiae bacterium]|nr:ACT domain-containing protein [Verrucomicrobiae bacterium]